MSTIDYYDKFAEDFEKIPFKDEILDLISTYGPKSADSEVLDIGSGPGNLAQSIDMKVTCIDPSLEMVRRCYEKGLKAIQGTFDEIEFNYKFDLVLAISSFIHLPKKDVEGHIRKVVELLNPSGVFIISMLIGEGEGWEDPHGKGLKRYFNYFQKQDLESIFQRTGLEILETKEVKSKKLKKTFIIYVLENR